MLTIYHNPRCSKSREGLQLLENSEQNFQVVNYLKSPLTKVELTNLLEKLSMQAIDLVRTKEKIWKVNFKGKELSEDEIIQVLVDYPTLIERPIVETDEKAVVGRPTEKINEIL